MLCCFGSRGGVDLQPVTDSAKNDIDNDNRIPLNSRQRFTLIKNWKGVSRHSIDAGALMIVKILTDHPQLYDRFTFASRAQFRTQSIDEQIADERLRDYADSMMTVFDDAIISIEKGTDAFFASIDRSAIAHADEKDYGVVEQFEYMEEAFMYAVRLTLDERCTDNMANIYRIIGALIVHELQTALLRRRQH